MRVRSKSNLGNTSRGLVRNRQVVMAEYDRLPRYLRQWCAQAALPFDPGQVRLLWMRWRGSGRTRQSLLDQLDAIAARALARERRYG